MDGSSDLAPSDFEKLKQLAKNIIDKYTISKRGTHLGIIEYSNNIRVKIPLDATHDPIQLKRLLDNITPSRGFQRFTAKALSKAVKQVFPASFGGKPGAHRVLIVVTAGPASDTEDIDSSIDETKKSGVDVFIVTVRESEEDAGRIAPDSNIVVVKTVDDFPSAADDLDKVIKDSIDKSKSKVRMYSSFLLTRSNIPYHIPIYSTLNNDFITPVEYTIYRYIGPSLIFLITRWNIPYSGTFDHL